MTGFPPDLYAGTAEYYEQFRPRYPEFMLAELRERVRRLGTILDLACGPGQIAIPMAAQRAFSAPSHGELLESAGYATERYDCTVPAVRDAAR